MSCHPSLTDAVYLCDSIHISEPKGTSSDASFYPALSPFVGFQLLVLSNMQPSQAQCQHSHAQTDDGVRASTRHILRCCRCRVHVAAVNTRSVTNHVTNGNGGRTLDQRPRERVGNPGHDDLVCGHGAHGHQKHGEETRTGARGTCCYRVADRS